VSVAQVISLLVFDDQWLFAETLATVLAGEPMFRLIKGGVPRDIGLAIVACASGRPDVAMLGLVGGSPHVGFEAARRIREVSPATRLLFLTDEPRDEDLVTALELGAAGFVHKREELASLFQAIRTVAQGRLLLDPAKIPDLLARVGRSRANREEAERRLAKLTTREAQVLELMATGLRNDRIAQTLYISPRTVETHVQNILRKLDAHSKLEAVALASQLELLAG
jgi:two-component system NarL family response regulator